MAYRVGVRVDKQNHGLQLEERLGLTVTLTGVGVVFFFFKKQCRDKGISTCKIIIIIFNPTSHNMEKYTQSE